MARRRNSAKPVIKETFTLYTPESVEAGDAADRGWIDEEGVDMTPDEYDREEGLTAVDKAVKHLRNEGATQASSTSFHKGIWYCSMHEQDFRTGEQEERCFHLDGFSPEEERAIFEQVTARRRFNPRTPRHNPPLPEHMAHNKLEDIAELLATRIIAETMTGRNGVFILGDFIYELSSQIRIQLRYAGVEGGDDDRALDLLTASEKVRSLFKDNGPLARMFPQHVGRSVR
jgi:hypothetical protein